MASTDRPNFFDLLALDPDAQWDDAKYKSQLEAMRAKWTLGQNAPGKPGEDAKRYLAMYKASEIQRVMEDPVAREAEVQACRADRATKKSQLDAILDEWKKHSSTFTKRQMNAWASLCAMPPAEVKDAAEKVGLTLSEDGKAGPSASTRIDPIIVAEVRLKLDTLAGLDTARRGEYGTLFTFLKKSDQASAEDLVKAAQEVYKDAQQINRTEILTKRSELSGQAMTIFKTEESKKAYSEALKREPLARLLDAMEQKVGGERPPEPYIQDYYADADKAGFKEEEAREELAARAEARKWGVIDAPTPRKRCPYCDELILASADACPKCGELLRLICPNCGATGIDVEAAACSKCGFATGKRAVVDDLLTDANDALSKRDYATATRYAHEARGMWSPRNADDLVRRMDSLDERLKEHARDLTAQDALDLLNQANAALDRGDLDGEQALVDQAQRLGVSNQEAISDGLEKLTVRRALLLLNKAEGAIRTSKYDDAQSLVDQVRSLGVAAQSEIAKRITALEVIKGQQLLTRAESAYRNAVYGAALDLITQVKGLSIDALASLAERIKDLETKLEAYQEQIKASREAERLAKEREQERLKTIVDSIETSVNDKRMSAARSRLQTLLTLNADAQAEPRLAGLRQRIDDALRAADALVVQAEAAPTDDERVALCLKALTACADHPGAEALLRRTPPPPPTNVRVTASTSATMDSVRIAWDAAPEAGASYYVVCKEGAPPLIVSDGRMIKREWPERACIDPTPSVGSELYYAVFTQRKQGNSFSQPATAPDPVVLAKDVTQARAEPGDRAVTLTWKAPERAAITVRRRAGAPPSSSTDGDEVRLNNPSSAVDTGLTNGAIYYYRIFCTFAGRVTSAGVTVNATPHIRPGSPPPLIISGQLNHVNWLDVELQWGEEPKKADLGASTGRRAVYRSDRKAPFKKGEIFSLTDVQPYVWSELAVVNGRASDQLPKPDITTYVPVVIVQDRVYSGAPQTYTFLPALEDVEARSIVGGLRITWKWPPHIEEAVIAEGRTLPDDPLQARGVTLIKRDPTGRGAFEAAVEAGKTKAFVVAAIIRPDGDPNGRAVASEPEKLAIVEGRAAELGVIEYEFIRPNRGWFSRGAPNHTLRLRVRGAGPLKDIPPLVVCYKEGKAPISPSDGSEWTTFARQALAKDDYNLLLPGLGRKPDGLFGAVFFSDAADARAAQLVSLGDDRAKL